MTNKLRIGSNVVFVRDNVEIYGILESIEDGKATIRTNYGHFTEIIGKIRVVNSK